IGERRAGDRGRTAGENSAAAGGAPGAGVLAGCGAAVCRVIREVAVGDGEGPAAEDRAAVAGSAEAVLTVIGPGRLAGGVVIRDGACRDFEGRGAVDAAAGRHA